MFFYQSHNSCCNIAVPTSSRNHTCNNLTRTAVTNCNLKNASGKSYGVHYNYHLEILIALNKIKWYTQRPIPMHQCEFHCIRMPDTICMIGNAGNSKGGVQIFMQDLQSDTEKKTSKETSKKGTLGFECDQADIHGIQIERNTTNLLSSAPLQQLSIHLLTCCCRSSLASPLPQR